MRVQSVKDALQRLLCDFEITLNCVRTIHKHFWFDDRHQIAFLTKRRVARQGFRVRVYACASRNVVANRDHGPPFCKPCSQLPILGQSLAQTIQTLSKFLARKIRHSLGALIYLDAWNDPLLFQRLYEGASVPSLLSNGLVKKDYAADKFA